MNKRMTRDERRGAQVDAVLAAKVARLPVWAQAVLADRDSQIARLKEDLELVREQLRAAAGAGEGSRVCLGRDPIDSKPCVWLPEDLDIEFDVADGKGAWRKHINVRLMDPRQPDVYEQALLVVGSDSIVVEPQASNVVRIKLVER